MRRSLLTRALYAARDFRSRALFHALREHCTGRVLDVGGGQFFVTAREQGARFERWVTLEVAASGLPARVVPNQHGVVGDGCSLPFASSSFDTALSVQVLEHVFEPIRMVEEIGRVLKPGGKAIFLVPQTSTTHLAPHYHGNFSRYWIAAALERAGLEPVLHEPLGGVWSSMASHLFYFFLQAARVEGMSDRALKRSALFYLLFPFMALWAVVALPVCLVFSLGDLNEEPNNHLVVARRRPPETATLQRGSLSR
jgi:SAM-dependent methyltransferase